MSETMVDYRGPPYQLPHRKPLPPPTLGNANLRPLTQIIPDVQRSSLPQINQSHNRTRTNSSSIFPQVNTIQTSPPHPDPVAHPSYQNVMNQYAPAPARRTLSNATTSTSTTGTGGGYGPNRTGSTVSVTLRRSTSSRSNGSPGGYVALMRKQKATVWCDRSQHEDPRILAQRKAAKMRAALEVTGSGGRSSMTSSTSMGNSSMMSRSKIRHHGKPVATTYTPASLVGGNGMPMRLSASEVGDDGTRDEDSDGNITGTHQRSGSGLSSLGRPSRQNSSLLRPTNANNSAGHSSPASNSLNGAESSPDGASEAAERASGIGLARTDSDYFTRPNQTMVSQGSSSSAEGERRFGDAGNLAATDLRKTSKEQTIKSPDELRRRGSVDDRTMTMSGVRLFVANPDLSD